MEWVGLKEHHPDLFELAKRYEKLDPATGERYTWAQNESLPELEKPERVAEILRNQPKNLAKDSEQANRPLFQVLAELDDDDDDEQACLICHL